MKTSNKVKFDAYYQQHCKHLKLKGLRPKTIEAYSRAIRRIGAYFNDRIDDFTTDELLDYFYQLKEKDILSCRNGMVTFRFRNSKMDAAHRPSNNPYQYKTIPAVDFLWLVIQHVLPRGFRRAGNYGFLHPNSKRMIRMIQWLFRLTTHNIPHITKGRKKKTCPCCGALMHLVMLGLPAGFRLPKPKPL